MAAVIQEGSSDAVRATERPPVVVVGAGPVGIRAVQELHRCVPMVPVVIYGDEPCEPYNRVRLSSFLGGALDWQALTRDFTLPATSLIQKRFGCAVLSIDAAGRVVRDAAGFTQPYSNLILATGSRPHVPEIPGVRLPGVYTFRDMGDAQQLLARRVRSRRVVVLGGGLLGLEAARAMQRFNTEVCVVEYYSRLMMRQLDEAGGALLDEHVRRLGIEVVLGESVRQVLGDAAVTGVKLRSERVIPCDTVIIATGIRPNIELARAAGVHVYQGIRVDDNMRTSDPHIYAVGECAEHRNRVYGVVAPGLEQAAVAAHRIAGGEVHYRGSITATRLKVLDLPVFSIGPATEEEQPDLGRIWRYRAGDVYRKIVTWRGRFAGAIAVGEWPELGRLQEAVTQGRRVWPWQLWRFVRTGALWPEQEAESVVSWPATATVCNCTGVTRGALGIALSGGCKTAAELAACTGASTVCGSCRPLLTELAGASGPAQPERGWKTLLGAGGIAFIVALALAFVIAIPYSATVQVPWKWDLAWRESLWKQVSGYTLLGISVVLLVLSLRKRVRRFTLGDFPLWRVAHVLLGVLGLAALAVHTGGRMGSNLNFALVAFFLALIAAGAVSGAVIGLEHRLGARAARLRRQWVWAHILLFWPIPVMLGLHVFKTYYF